MKQQIYIYPNLNLSNQERGKFFEDLIRLVFETQRFKITQTINFTGFEIDLKAEHMDREETAYIECKARERIDSSDVKQFAFTVNHKEMNYGFFLSTTDFEHQVAGLIEEIKLKPNNNLYFWGPDKIIDLLESSDYTKPPNIEKIKRKITKKILLFTNSGTFYIFIIRKDSLPSHYKIYNSFNRKEVIDKKLVAEIKKIIPDIENLEILYSNKNSKVKENNILETIAEVQESEDWYDYLPASTKYFVGRKDLRSDINSFLKQVSQKQTSRRVFFIEGKSGWGKSSLITDLKGRSRNKYYKNRIFTLAIDARSASTSNFVALSFKKLLDEAIKTKFIDKKYAVKKIPITSSFDVLDSQEIKDVLNYLEKKGKILILIFDQFEDVFRKPGIFKVFYKFLMDVNVAKTNLVVGFSWKSEINIPIDHEAYHFWQQAKSIACSISVREFNSSEIKGVVKQLERAIGKSLELDLRRRLIESSQGFPWLIKKLCIHTYKQIKNGVTTEKLIEQDLNCEVLFKKDLEELTAVEMKALEYISKRAYEGSFFDITELDESINEEVVSALIHKRLIIKSGTKYNIYWDIFRDYLVTGEIPTIGESYILRQSVKSCLEIYNIFLNEKTKLTMNKIKSLHKKHDERSIDNVLRDLRTIGLVQKSGEYFYLSHPEALKNDNSFKQYLQNKFSKYTIYLRLKNIKSMYIERKEFIEILKNIFKGTNFSEKTWIVYSYKLAGWLKYADLDISPKIFVITPRKSDSKFHKTFTPQRAPEIDIYTLRNLDKIFDTKVSKKYNSFIDLKTLGLAKVYDGKVVLTESGELILKYKDTNKINKAVASEAANIYKLRKAAIYVKNKPNAKSRDILNDLPELTSNIKAYRLKANTKLLKWGKFINYYCDNIPDIFDLD